MTVAVGLRRTPAGRRLVVSRPVAAPAEEVWSLLVDTRRWPDWGPSVTAVECTDREIRAGSTGRVRTPLGVWLPFEVTTRADYRWTWRVAGIPAPGHRVEPRDAGCVVAFDLHPLAAPYVPVCVVALRRISALAAQSRR